MNTITVYEDEGGKWRWRLRLANNKNFAVSGESFARKGNARRAAEKLASLIVGDVLVQEAKE